MLKIEKVDLSSKKAIDDFVYFPFKLYKGVPQWVPPFPGDIKVMMDRSKHPFYDHSDADFFVAKRGDEIVGRVAALENRPYNKVHDKKIVSFYLFDTVDDAEVAGALIDCVLEWGKARGLEMVVGPKGFTAFDGYGIQVKGFEHRQMMTMMNYNFPYYSTLLEGLGFTKEVDFVSCYLQKEKFIIPDKVHEVARRVQERGTFRVSQFKTKADLRNWVKRIGVTYNNTFVNNWEYYPLTDRELTFMLDNLLMVADPKLIKAIFHEDEVVGFLFAFPDISAALQRQKGRLHPIALADYLLEFKRTKWVSLNGAGVLPEFHGRGGNALLYDEMGKTIRDYQFVNAELTQVAESAVQMRKDLATIGGEEYKNHRVYRRPV
jgi:hypothetical protein